MSTLTLLLIIFCVLALAGGGYGHLSGWGPYAWSPVAVVLVVLLILLLTGKL